MGLLTRYFVDNLPLGACGLDWIAIAADDMTALKAIAILGLLGTYLIIVYYLNERFQLIFMLCYF